MEQLVIPGVLKPSIFEILLLKTHLKNHQYQKKKLFSQINIFMYKDYRDPETQGACWKPHAGKTKMLFSLIHNGKMTNVDVDCASWRNYCRMPNLILIYFSILELKNTRSINFIPTILIFQWLFFIWGNFFINLETSMQLRFMSNLEMWQNIWYNFISCIKL